MRRHRDVFHTRKSSTRDAKRKAVKNRAHLEKYFSSFKKFLEDEDIKAENTWNADETGFMVRYLQKGTFIWTFSEINTLILTDSHDLVSVTRIKAISAARDSIQPFLSFLVSSLQGVSLKITFLTMLHSQ